MLADALLAEDHAGPALDANGESDDEQDREGQQQADQCAEDVDAALAARPTEVPLLVP